MKIIIRVTASKSGQHHYLNVDNVVHFTDANDGGTLIYLAASENPRLFVRERPQDVLQLIDDEILRQYGESDEPLKRAVVAEA